MSPIVLRDYQRRGVDALERLILSGKRRVLAVAPTGAGKGTMAAHMLAETAKAGGTALFVVHRREILYDMHDRLMQQGVTAGIIMGEVRPNRALPVQLASVQTLIHETKKRMEVDLMVVDEAHHYAADEWRQASDHVSPFAVVGFTATPQRADGRPLGDMFDYLVDVVSYSELLDRGDIVPCKVLRPEVPLGQDLADEGAEAYLRYTPKDKAFIFTRGLIEAAECADTLLKKGVRARVVDTNTADKERAETMRLMRAGELDVIVNYYTMAEGIDIPAVSTVVLARSVQHEGAYMQMVGRALRSAPGKTCATVLDLCGASFTHGMPLDNRAYSLRAKGMTHAGGDVRVLKRRGTRAPDLPPNILHLDLVEATAESQRIWGRRRIDWDAVGFGQKTDADIATQLGVSRSVVTRIRTEKKLQSVRKYGGLGIDWAQVDLAGRSDAQLARELGVHSDTVRAARKRLGIGKTMRGKGVTVQDVDWDHEPLGKEPDYKIAERLRVSSSTVFLHRTRRGIPPFQVQDLGIDWDAQPYRKLSDAEIGRKLGVSRKAVQRQREARGIPPLNPPSRLPLHEHRAIDWEAVDFTQTDLRNAEILGTSRWTVREARMARGLPTPPRAPNKSGINWDAQPLGKMLDAVLAEQLGVHPQTVRIERARRKIPSVLPVGRTPKGHRVPTLPPAPRSSKSGPKGIDWDAQPLGKKSDTQIARELGLDPSSVRDQRQKRGIPPFSVGRPPKRPEGSRRARASSR